MFLKMYWYKIWICTVLKTEILMLTHLISHEQQILNVKMLLECVYVIWLDGSDVFDLSDQGNSKESWLPVCEDNKMIYKYFPFTETDGLQLS